MDVFIALTLSRTLSTDASADGLPNKSRKIRSKILSQKVILGLKVGRPVNRIHFRRADFILV